MADLPELIAHALVSNACGQAPRVSYLVKYPIVEGSCSGRGDRLNETDRQIFDQVCADLTPLEDKATAENVQPYLDKFNAQSATIGWTVGVCWESPVHNAGVVRQYVITEHRAAITSARRDGRLRTVSPTTRLPVDHCRGDAEASIDEIEKYVGQLGLSIRLAAPERTSEAEASNPLKGRDNYEGKNRPKPQQRHQEDEILEALRNDGLNPEALPKQKNGTAGIKKKIKNQLAFSGSVFNQAWERLLKSKAIGYQK